jgi:hypothetical protein
MKNFVLFRTFMNSSEILIIKSLFECENIRFYIKNDVAISIHPSLGGIEIYVHVEDEEKAKVLCHKIEF